MFHQSQHCFSTRQGWPARARVQRDSPGTITGTHKKKEHVILHDQRRVFLERITITQTRNQSPNAQSLSSGNVNSTTGQAVEMVIVDSSDLPPSKYTHDKV